MSATLDPLVERAKFPLLNPTDGSRPLIYLDSAATSQKPQEVIDAMSTYYETINANVHRGVYRIAQQATDATEAARAEVAAFVGARSPKEIVFTKNATEALNLLARTWGKANLGPGDAIVLSAMEHHANIVPWQMAAAEQGFEIRWLRLTADGQLDLENLDTLLDGAKLLSITQMSNVLGTTNPVDLLVEHARRAGALVCLDACQSVPHAPVNATALDVDFMAFSAHKMCGPTGIGALWGRAELLDPMPPFLGGGEMIRDVTMDGFTTNEIPWKFEAGTPPIAEIIGFGAAVRYLTGVGMDAVDEHCHRLTTYALRTLTERFGDDITIHGPKDANLRGGVMSFGFRGLHPHDISQILDQHDVCVRAGHHCAKPLMRELGVGATARASWTLYNTESDIDALADALDATGAFFL